MDDIPSSARIALFYVTLSYVSLGNANAANLELYAASGDAVVTTPNAARQGVAKVNGDPNSNANSNGCGTMIMVPLDSSQTFKLGWSAVNTAVNNIFIYYRGFIDA